ncbi:MAG TPA: carboxypeptidase-like regulatory domain-containing protein [Vicinamibacterales bacterium]
MANLLRRALILSLPLLGACSDSPQSLLPTAPTSMVPSGNTNSVQNITGSVFDTASRPLPGAKVVVVDGPSAGASGIVNSSGVVVLAGNFDSSTRFQASIDGHETLTVTWTCSVANCANNARPWLGFQLRPLVAPIDLAGEYVMTITANASCVALPANARSRSYPVTHAKHFREGTADLLGFNGVVHNDDVVASLREFRIGVAGNFVSMYFRRGDGDEPGLVEHLADDRYVGFTGNAAGTVNAGTNISIAFSGSVDNLELRAPPGATLLMANVISRQSCESSEHRLMLARR